MNRILLTFLAVAASALCYAAMAQDSAHGWVKNENNPIVVPEEGSWDAAACYKPTVYRDVKKQHVASLV